MIDMNSNTHRCDACGDSYHEDLFGNVGAQFTLRSCGDAACHDAVKLAKALFTPLPTSALAAYSTHTARKRMQKSHGLFGLMMVKLSLAERRLRAVALALSSETV
jgi:hypothetical protein